MRNRIKAVMFAATLALAGAMASGQGQVRKSEASALCGSQTSGTSSEYYVACVDFDKLRELTGAPAFGKQTQVFVDARNQDVVAVRVTAKRGDEERTYLAEPFKQPHGRRIAVAVFEGLDWETVAVQVLIEEK